MNPLRELLQSLGTAGAVRNAGALASARRREDWVVAALQRNIARATPPAHPAPQRRADATPLRRTA